MRSISDRGWWQTGVSICVDAARTSRVAVQRRSSTHERKRIKRSQADDGDDARRPSARPKNEKKILCDGGCAVPDGGSVQIQESLYVEVEGLEGKRRERHSKSL